jgi:hypothetical protein
LVRASSSEEDATPTTPTGTGSDEEEDDATATPEGDDSVEEDAENAAPNESRRQVPREEAEAYAKENGLLFFEASAKTGEGVVEVFTEIGASSSLDPVHHPDRILTVRPRPQRRRFPSTTSLRRLARQEVPPAEQVATLPVRPVASISTRQRQPRRMRVRASLRVALMDPVIRSACTISPPFFLSFISSRVIQSVRLFILTAMGQLEGDRGRNSDRWKSDFLGSTALVMPQTVVYQRCRRHAR